MYSLEYLKVARQDMVEVAKYISKELHDPTAALRLADEMVNSAEELTKFPYSNPVHFTAKPLKREYRKLMVKNYIMFYWIDELEMRVIIARVMYSRRDIDRLLR